MKDNIDANEIAKFDSLAANWWDPDGEFRPLHDINPLRLDWIRQRAHLPGNKVVDIGCGGGILTESMASKGAVVSGIDMAEKPLGVARLHQIESGTDIEYIQCTAESLASDRAGEYDIVTCLEMLEHVPSPSNVIAACQKLARPGGDVFFLKLLPQGTHEYDKFIRPSELESWARTSGLHLKDSIGMHYNPLLREYTLGPNIDVNYLMHFRKSETI